jgi:histidinol phosphatase-like enzyme
MKSTFIDRDGTVFWNRDQLDSLDKLEFYPKHFSIWLKLQLSWITIGDDQSRRIRNG